MIKGPAVLVVRADDEFSSLLRHAGFQVTNLELVKTQPLEDLSELQVKIGGIERYDGLFFTSPAAAEVFVSLTKQNGVHFAGKVYALGRRAKPILEKAGFNVVWFENANTSEELITVAGENEFAGKRFLFVRGDRSTRTIPEMLGRTARIEEAIVYRTLECPPAKRDVDAIARRLREGEIDWLCLFSPSGLDSFRHLFGPLSSAAYTAAIGETTGRHARENGFDVRFISPRAGAADFAQALIAHINDN